MSKLNFKLLLSYLPICLLFAGLIILNLHQTFITYTVTKENIPLTMTFSGIVKPLDLVNVTSPADGTVSRILEKFGDTVKKGDALFYIESPQLQSTLRTSITNFLKTKADFDNTTYQHTGNIALYKAGLTAKVDYMNAEAQFQSAKLALWNARLDLVNALKDVGISEATVEKLTLNDIDKIQTLIIQATGQLKIVSPAEGILSSQNRAGGGFGDDNELSVGSSVKKGDIIAIIYEMKGLTFTINISELLLHDISIGQPAIITGAAFPTATLHGYVKSINHEANNTGDPSFSLPTYTIRIIVPKITAEQRQLIQDGMSAEINLIKERPLSIHIPLNALIHKPNGYFVDRVNPKDGSIQEVPVTTGDTDETSVEIKSGLNEGDKIVIPD